MKTLMTASLAIFLAAGFPAFAAYNVDTTGDGVADKLVDTVPTMLDAETCVANVEAMVKKMKKGGRQGPYRPDWASLKQHNAVPEWFRDGKFGIYFHWGVYAVPAFGSEKYLAGLYHKEGRIVKHHTENWGAQDEFGYHHFVPLFTAEHFDAEEWAELFKETGARWAGPVAVHHDSYAMWDSEMTPWNAMDTGPHQDITGEMEKAIKKRGMKFVTSFHHERNQSFVQRLDGTFSVTKDPVLQFMYANMSKELFDKIFQAMLGEVIDKYEPDLIWFDGRLNEIPEHAHLNFLSYYLNRAAAWDKEVMITTKKLQYPQEISVLDFEKGRTGALTPYPWLNDDTISQGSWGYTDALTIKPARVVLHDFIDTVSKNGHLLLNLSPKADGTIPQDQRDCLNAFGDWLKVNGEAIYATRPWLDFGEGPTKLKKAGSHQKTSLNYTGKDIRFTRSKDGKTLFIMTLGRPDEALSPSILQVDGFNEGKVELLGREGELEFTVENKKLTIHVPEDLPESMAYAFKLSRFQVSLTPEGAARRAAAEKKMKQEPIDPGKAGATIRFGQ